jgi:hypothetical protein
MIPRAGHDRGRGGKGHFPRQKALRPLPEAVPILRRLDEFDAVPGRAGP